MIKVSTVAMAALLLSATAAEASDVPATEDVVDLALADGARQRVLQVMPPHPRAAIVMLPGGSGRVGERRDGDLRHDSNFVVRTRWLWAARGFAVLIPDAIEGESLRGLRSSLAYGALVDELAATAHRVSGAPVFLLGTSQGSIAAMNGAAHAPAGALAGLVLTESVSVMGRSGETVFSADPAGVRVPALVVANRADDCDVAPPAMAGRIAAAMVHAPAVVTLFVDGGAQRSGNPCGSLSPHGYDGIEEQVVDAIARWMETQLRDERAAPAR